MIGYENIAIGFRALYQNRESRNIAIGHEVMWWNSTGSRNTASGYRALNKSTSGDDNTGYGYEALYNNTTGSYNTSVGYQALYSNTTGTLNTAIGYFANVSAGNLTNATAIGYNAIANASNKVRIGNSSVTVIEGQVAYTFPSDGRFKINISENIRGLDFIMKLRPVSYNFQTKKYDAFIKGEIIGDAKFASATDYTESENLRHNGFIAQEVEKAAKETGYEFDGVITPKNTKEAYGLSYSQFVVPLVKAVQQQQQQIETLKKENVEIKLKLEQIQQQLQLLISRK